MADTLSGLERQAAPVVGARFFAAQDGTEMFAFRIDSGNEIGPRPVTDADKTKHAQAWKNYVNGLQAAAFTKPVEVRARR